LIPTPLAAVELSNVLPEYVIKIMNSLNQFIVEDIRTARRFITKSKHPLPIDKIQFRELNEHSTEKEISLLLPYLLEANTGLLSEAGVPCVADPGEKIVRLAHANNIKIIPFVGPSSIIMALMSSGLNGQSFSFTGYLPVKSNERQARIRFLEKRSSTEHQTQIFIETPYRNMQLLNDIMLSCRNETQLTIAANLSSPEEFIKTMSIREWKKNLPDLHKVPTVFLLLA
jgi:16S rRNA (cytidine1402-2'-O)-methyltransferase